MGLGVQVTMQDLNYQAGQIAVNLNDYYNRAVEIKQYIDLVGVEGLEVLGFTTEEANTLKQAFNDLEYQKIESFDSSEAVKKLYGMGIKSVP